VGQRLRLALVGVSGALVLLAAACAPSDDGVAAPADGEHAATTAPADGERTATAAPGGAAVPERAAGPGTPPPAAEAPGAPPATATRAEGDAGTVADPDGHPPAAPQPAADLRGVDVAGADGALHARFALDGPVPEDVASLLWSLELYVEDELAYTVTVQQLGSERLAAVFDWAEVDQTPLDDTVTVAGDTVEIAVPWSLLPRARDGYAWVARTELDQAWEDRLPAAGTVEVRP
jgi:hypothetical protein